MSYVSDLVLTKVCGGCKPRSHHLYMPDGSIMMTGADSS